MAGRSNPTTSLNCWREVAEFRSAVSQVEQVNLWAYLFIFTCIDLVFLRTTLPHYVDQNYVALVQSYSMLLDSILSAPIRYLHPIFLRDHEADALQP